MLQTPLLIRLGENTLVLRSLIAATLDLLVILHFVVRICFFKEILSGVSSLFVFLEDFLHLLLFIFSKTFLSSSDQIFLSGKLLSSMVCSNLFGVSNLALSFSLWGDINLILVDFIMLTLSLILSIICSWISIHFCILFADLDEHVLNLGYCTCYIISQLFDSK